MQKASILMIALLFLSSVITAGQYSSLPSISLQKEDDNSFITVQWENSSFFEKTQKGIDLFYPHHSITAEYTFYKDEMYLPMCADERWGKVDIIFPHWLVFINESTGRDLKLLSAYPPIPFKIEVFTSYLHISSNNISWINISNPTADVFIPTSYPFWMKIPLYEYINSLFFTIESVRSIRANITFDVNLFNSSTVLELYTVLFSNDFQYSIYPYLILLNISRTTTSTYSIHTYTSVVKKEYHEDSSNGKIYKSIYLYAYLSIYDLGITLINKGIVTLNGSKYLRLSLLFDVASFFTNLKNWIRNEISSLMIQHGFPSDMLNFHAITLNFLIRALVNEANRGSVILREVSEKAYNIWYKTFVLSNGKNVLPYLVSNKNNITFRYSSLGYFKIDLYYLQSVYNISSEEIKDRIQKFFNIYENTTAHVIITLFSEYSEKMEISEKERGLYLFRITKDGIVKNISTDKGSIFVFKKEEDKYRMTDLPLKVKKGDVLYLSLPVSLSVKTVDITGRNVESKVVIYNNMTRESVVTNGSKNVIIHSGEMNITIYAGSMEFSRSYIIGEDTAITIKVETLKEGIWIISFAYWLRYYLIVIVLVYAISRIIYSLVRKR